MRRVAYCEVPKLAGVYTFALNLAEHLPNYGYELRLVGVGPQARADYATCLSVLPATVLAGQTTDVDVQAQALTEWLRAQRMEIVMVSGSQTEHELVGRLPEDVRVISVVNNATRGHYRIATAYHERMHRIVCVSPRLVRDVVGGFGVPPHKVELIPYGIRTDEWAGPRVAGPPGIRIVYLGRLCDSAKGVFLIPRILSRLERAGVAFHLTVIGDGPDAPRFFALLRAAGLERRCTNAGLLRYDAVARELARHDVLLMPSRHEGLPLTLLEGMAAGCVPVASRLPGITDYAVSSPDEGVLCPPGDVAAFAAALSELAADPERLRRMSGAARRRVCDQFSSAQMARRYAALFDAVLHEPAMPPVRRRARKCDGPVPVRLLRRVLPPPLKNAVRTLCERAGVTV